MTDLLYSPHNLQPVPTLAATTPRKYSNSEKKRETNRRWAAKHIDKIRKYQRQHYINNPELKRARDHRRLARKAQTTGTFTAQQFKALCAHFTHHCLRCGKPRKLTADHVIPLAWADRPEFACAALGDIDNIQPLCRSCNSWKKDSHFDYRTRPHQNCINPPMVEDYLA